MKKKGTFWAMGLSLFFLCALLTHPGNALGGPSISVSPNDYDAGDLTKAPDLVEKVFKIYNNGDSPLNITKIKYT
jgi:hypothetical protein